MRYSFKLNILLGVIILPIALFAQQPVSYEITGRIKGLKDGDKVTMTRLDGVTPFNLCPNTDLAFVKNGEFHLTKYDPKDGPRYYWLTFVGHKDKTCRLFIDNREKVKLTCDSDIDKIGHTFIDQYIRIEGSPSNQAWHNFEDVVARKAFNYPITDQEKALDKVRDSVGFDPVLVGKILISKEKIYQDFYTNYLKNPKEEYKPDLPMFAFDSFSTYLKNNSVWLSYYNTLDDYWKNSWYGQLLKKKVVLAVGQSMPLFILSTDKGQPVALRYITTKSKLTLVHFWATKSEPRNKMDLELRTMYQKYHALGLNVIGVNSDSYREEFKETMQKESFPWINVFDKKGQKFVDPIYHEYGGNPENVNTTNVLLDAKGKIIAWDVTGLELQWYLWNELENKSKINL